jgi:hypothetical protein
VLWALHLWLRTEGLRCSALSHPAQQFTILWKGWGWAIWCEHWALCSELSVPLVASPQSQQIASGWWEQCLPTARCYFCSESLALGLAQAVEGGPPTTRPCTTWVPGANFSACLELMSLPIHGLSWLSSLIHYGHVSQDTLNCDYRLFSRLPSKYFGLKQEVFSQEGTILQLSKIREMKGCLVWC